jgi:phosphatidate cytidylyltransferase
MADAHGTPATPAASRTADIGIRLLSGIVLAVVALGAIWLGGRVFTALVALGAVILVSEWSGISRSRFLDRAVLVGGVAVVTTAVVVGEGYSIAALAILLVGAAAAQLTTLSNDPARAMWIGVLYGGLPAISLVLLRADAAFGLVAILWLMVLVWATDVGGYIFGSLVGGPKLAPRISPKKTWAGFLGGLVAAIVASAAVDFFAMPGVGAPIWLAGVLSVVSQIGDLAESAFKRRFGVKDSSRLIPGHGGLMDRIDGLVAAAVVAALIGLVRGGPQAAGSGLLLW